MYYVTHGTCQARVADHPDAPRHPRVLRARPAPRPARLRLRPSPHPGRGRRADHQRRHHLPAAEPAAPRRPGHHHLARVAQRPTAALLPAHQCRPGSPGAVHQRMGPLHHRGRPPAHPRRHPMTTKVDALVDRYLTDLEAELRGLPANRRRELLDEVGEHITAARAALDPETEAAIRTVLERLGDPADIAAEARERFGVQAEPARPIIPWLELLTLAILVLVPVTI